MGADLVAGLTLVRHGSTEWSELGRYTGWADLPLSAAGQRQARKLRRSLAAVWAGVWSSDLRRALDTATIAGFTPVTDPRLRELDFGDLEGLRFADLDPDTRSAVASFDGFHAPNGESVAELRARVAAFLDALPRGENLVFTHGGVIRSVLREHGEDRPIGPGAVVRIGPSR